MADAFGTAVLDHYRGQQTAPLIQRDGEDTRTHPIEDFYFSAFDGEPGADWTASWLDGPLLDVGAGAGRDALYFQDQYDTVALEVSGALVTLLEERGVDAVCRGDMLALRDQFDPGRFRSVLVVGTQLGLTKSPRGLRAFLDDLAYVTTPGASAVVDCYDPTYDGAEEMLGFRADSTPGLAYRTLHYEYDDIVGETLLFRLFSPDSLRDVAGETEWTVAEVHRPHDAYYYRAALTRQ